MTDTLTPKTSCPLGLLTDTQIADLLRVRPDLGILEVRTEERFKANLQALNLQAREYERRLEHLNGEQARIKEERSLLADQLRREIESTANGCGKDLFQLKEILLREIAQLREMHVSFVSEQRGVNKGMGTLWAVGAAALALLLSGLGLWFSRS